jgi:hypothetical protein
MKTTAPASRRWLVLLACLLAPLAVACAWWAQHPAASELAGAALDRSGLICATITDDAGEREVCASAAALGRALLELEAAELAPVDCPLLSAEPAPSSPPPALPEASRVVPAGGATP